MQSILNRGGVGRWLRGAAVVTLMLGAGLGSAPMLFGQPPEGQSEFVPVTDLPASEQLPAAPLLIAAYVFVWVALMVYVWSLWRRLGKVEQDLAALARSTPQKLS